MKKIVENKTVFKSTKGKEGPKMALIKELKNKKKLKSLPDKPIPLGGGPFVGRHTTG
jgi:hypothetical protein